jgi:hypothetical protein
MIDKNLKSSIINCLNDIKGGGTFCTDGVKNFVFPHLSIHGLGELAYPINELQARALISVAHKAPFGKGHDTILDPSVRSAWEIDASQLKFEGQDWQELMDSILKNVQNNLGIEDYTIEAQIYKLLIYEKGDFFLTHKDSEKEKGMFGTLIVALPSNHKGAELLVRFEGVEKSIDFSHYSSQGKIVFGAFYADCDHEVKPLLEGYRVVLVYNLIQKSSGKDIAVQSYKKHVECLKACLTKAESQISDSNRPMVVLLNHQYTPENFIQEQLKLNDRAKAIALLQAAKEAGIYANLCLVTATKEGSPLEYDEDCEIIDEIIDESISIEKWIEDGYPGLGDFHLDDDHIIAPFNMDDDEPYEVENSGYMGNYGPDITYWYHYGAIAMWTEVQHKRILLGASDAIRINWLDYYNTNRDKLKHKDLEMARYLVQILSDLEQDKEKFDFGPVIDWLILENDKEQLKDLGYNLLARYFFKIKAEKWLELGQHYGIESINELLNNHIKSWNQRRVKQLIAILHEFSEKSQFDEFVGIQMALLPSYYFKMMTELRANEFPIDAKTLTKLAVLENTWPQTEIWMSSMFGLLTRCESYEYLEEVWAMTMLDIKTITPLILKILNETITRYSIRKNNKPEPPKDWTRPIPQDTRFKNNWAILEPFMQSPTTQVLEYRRVQKERDDMEYTIRNSDADLKTETIKKGSPYTLLITKTQDHYLRQMKIWNHDCMILEKLERKK